MTAQAGDTIFLDGEAKQQWRRRLREARKAIPAARRKADARRTAIRAMRLLRHRRVRCVAVYLASGSELDTAPLIVSLRRKRCRVLVPRLGKAQGRMAFVPLGRRVRHRNRYGIAEPGRFRHVPPRGIDAVVVPLLGFDQQGTRLGSGGGYYDRWFARHAAGRRPLRIGYAFDEQCIDVLPRQPWDHRLHAVLTPRRAWWFARN